MNKKLKQKIKAYSKRIEKDNRKIDLAKLDKELNKEIQKEVKRNNE